MPDDPPVIFEDDNPEWTAADFARARSGEAMPDWVFEVFPSTRRRGRPPGSTKAAVKQQVTLRLDPEVIEKFKAGGPGWQTRINEALRKAAV